VKGSLFLLFFFRTPQLADADLTPFRPFSKEDEEERWWHQVQLKTRGKQANTNAREEEEERPWECLCKIILDGLKGKISFLSLSGFITSDDDDNVDRVLSSSRIAW